MAGLNKNLQDYLSRSSTSVASSSTGTEKSGGFGLGRFNFFNRNSEPVPDDTGDVANSWFSKAQNDPLFPDKETKNIWLCIVFVIGDILFFNARKFAVLYTLGSLFVIFSFSFLWGPVNHLKHLFSVPRLPFTSAYFGTLFATLYFALWSRSTVLTVICAVLQILSLVWYIVSYIPGGQTGLKFFTKIFYAAASKTVQKTLPV
ncbi:hypothetical protein KUTeg_001785 [Tegillarca granosa]|uniref:Vesicle transport protein n=1 Tax=Tegillarca granosa TaxID=220873 RepID=A0ABQ9FSG5_TEGGR|nr:hypothetical protein KUTeg_001785 [Tegillarca granosa]